MASSLARNYAPLPVRIVRGRDVWLWDDAGKKYMDLLAGYSAVNQGHCHPAIVKQLRTQARTLTLTSRVVMTDTLDAWADKITRMFKYERVLAMNSGAEAVETALKMARRVGPRGSKIVCMRGNFHGRTLGAISMSDYAPYRAGFGPMVPNMVHVPFNDGNALMRTMHRYPVSAIVYEPVQGEGGVIPATEEFLKSLASAKAQFPKTLLIADEIQSGLGRSGSRRAHCHTSSDPMWSFSVRRSVAA